MYKPDCGLYAGGEVPPCSAFLSNDNPIIKDGKLIYKNENKLFYFIGAAPSGGNVQASSGSIASAPSIVSNLQISLNTFIIGLFINQIQLDSVTYDKACAIHSDQAANAFIHEVLQSPKEVNFNFNPTLSFVISNGNAILPLYTYTLNITSRNYLILFILNRLEGNPALFWGNNSFVTEDDINFALAALNIQFPAKASAPAPIRPPVPVKARNRFMQGMGGSVGRR